MALLQSSFLLLTLLATLAVGDGYLGVMLANQPRPTVAEVVPGSPAEKAGLQVGDVITAVDANETKDVDTFAEAIRKRNAGDKVKLTLERGGRTIAVEVVLAKRFEEEAPPARLEPKVAPPTRPYLGMTIEEGQGVVVVSVLEDAPAAKAGIRKGDQLRKIGGKPVADLEAVDRVLAGLMPGQRIEVEVERAGRMLAVELLVGSRPAAQPAQPGGVAEPGRAAQPGATLAPVAPRPKDPTPSPVRQVEPPAPPPPQPTPPILPRPEERRAETFAAAREIAGKTRLPILAFFSASWSASCQAQARSLGDVSLAELRTKVVQVVLDTDKEGQLADQYGVRELPTLALIGADGKLLERATGYQAPDLVKAMLQRHVVRTREAAAVAPARRDAAQAPAGQRELEAEVRQLRAEVRELRELVRKLQAGR